MGVRISEPSIKQCSGNRYHIWNKFLYKTQSDQRSWKISNLRNWVLEFLVSYPLFTTMHTSENRDNFSNLKDMRNQSFWSLHETVITKSFRNILKFMSWICVLKLSLRECSENRSKISNLENLENQDFWTFNDSSSALKISIKNWIWKIEVLCFWTIFKAVFKNPTKTAIFQ